MLKDHSLIHRTYNEVKLMHEISCSNSYSFQNSIAAPSCRALSLPTLAVLVGHSGSTRVLSMVAPRAMVRFAFSKG